jgi:pimeloyl-ACP methyl ester carboxylesterase
VRYARVDDSHVAHRVIVGDGGGTHDVVFLLGGTASMEALFEDPVGVRFLDGLAALGRLVVFDRRGIGLSDPPGDGDLSYEARWSDDIEAVVAAVQIARAVVVSGTTSWTPSVLYCDRHPDRVASLVSLEPSPPFRFPADMIRGQIAGEIDSIGLFCPSRADEPGFREWFTRAGRFGASPIRAANAYPTWTHDDVREIHAATARISAPTLVLRRPASQYSPPPPGDPVVALVRRAVGGDFAIRDRRVSIAGPGMCIGGGAVQRRGRVNGTSVVAGRRTLEAASRSPRRARAFLRRPAGRHRDQDHRRRCPRHPSIRDQRDPCSARAPSRTRE